MSDPHVTVLGGGHGLAATIRAVRQYADRVTAVVATADDGGSSGRLRAGLALPAPGDLRRCLVAMAGAEDDAFGAAFEYRFGGTDVEGHALGNLVLAGLAAVSGDFLAGVDEAARLLGQDATVGRVLPATVEPVELHGRTTSGDRVVGQVAISRDPTVEQVWLEPSTVAVPAAVTAAIQAADQVVLGPGSLYTSVLAAVVTPGVVEALASRAGPCVYVCNLKADAGEADGYDVGGHVAALCRHGVRPDVVLVDEFCALPLGTVGAGTEVVTAPVARGHGLSHDSGKLASALGSLVGR